MRSLPRKPELAAPPGGHIWVVWHKISGTSEGGLVVVGTCSFSSLRISCSPAGFSWDVCVRVCAQARVRKLGYTSGLGLHSLQFEPRFTRGSRSQLFQHPIITGLREEPAQSPSNYGFLRMLLNLDF